MVLRRVIQLSLRLRLPRLTTPPTVSSKARTLTTTAPLSAGVKAQKAQPSTIQRAQTLGFKGPRPIEGPKKAPFAEGERKALKNRIVLSNTNAPFFELEPLSTTEITTGEVYGFRNVELDGLRALEGFKRGQNWKFFAAPSTVVRKESVGLRDWMAGVEGGWKEVITVDMDENGDGGMKEEREIKGTGEVGRTECVILRGEKGSGKSVLMLQSMSWALQRGWVVVHIPNAQDLVIGHTEYAPEPSGLYSQRDYTASLLARTLSACKSTLASIPLSAPAQLSRTLTLPVGGPRSTLASLCSAGAKDPSVSHEAFTALMSELSSNPKAPRVLFALDNLGQISLPSAYRSPEFKVIHAHDLALPATFLSYLNGSKTFTNGGLVLAATSSNCARTEALNFALRHEELPAYSKLDKRIAESVASTKVVSVSAMERNEAEGLLEYCRRSGLVQNDRRLSGVEVAERIAIAGGLAKELVGGCIRVRG